MRKTFGVTALIFGIISVPFNLVPPLLSFSNKFWGSDFPIISIIGWIICGTAIIFGILGTVTDDSKGSAIIGLVLGIFGLFVGLLLRFLFANFFILIIL
jgi:hypothetical protein